jgi:hypothetical protein
MFSLFSCEDNETKFELNGSRYFPLHVGNTWKLVPDNPSGAEITIVVTEEALIHGKRYYKIHQVDRPATPDPPSAKYRYFRIDDNDFVYVLSDSAGNVETNTLRLGAPDKYKWKMSSTEVTVIKSNENINGHSIDECKTYFYNNLSASDDEYAITLAPGIGYLRIDGSFGRASRLSSALINGVEYNFD